MKVLIIVGILSFLLPGANTFPLIPASKLDDAQAELMVSRHNHWRGKVKCKPVKWSKELARYAQEWADQLASKGCEMKHRPPDKFGENIYWSSGLQNQPDHVVDSWGSEIEFYNEKKNSCKGNEVCGHYTQLVWCNTTEIGCGMAKCGNEEIWVCNYDPPGNWVGERPYPLSNN